MSTHPYLIVSELIYQLPIWEENANFVLKYDVSNFNFLSESNSHQC